MRLPTQLLLRKLNTHKGDFGHIFILAGSIRYSGAALLCAEAAMRAGAGLVTIGLPESLSLALIKRKPKEVMILPLPETKQGNLSLQAFNKINFFLKDINVVVIGPGLGQEKSTQSLIRKLVSKITVPVVIDADGLNALTLNLKLLEPNMILTPHPGEMSRLSGKSVKEIQGDRLKVTRSFAKAHKVTLVLKGHNTVVSDFSGNTYVNRSGNPGMATAGAGDVLSGVIAAFLGQGLDLFKAAKFGVYLHGLAGDLAAKEKTQLSLIASDIIDKLPQAIKKSS